MRLTFLLTVLIITMGITSYPEFIIHHESEFNIPDTTIRSEIKFEKLIWHSNRCSYNMCPVLSVMITSDKDIKLRKLVYGGVNLSEVDTLKSGTFKSVLDDSTYSVLMRLLNGSYLKTAVGHDPSRPPLIMDASSGTLEIYFNNERKFFWTLDSPLPGKLSEVLFSLDLIEYKTKFQRTTEVFEF